MGERFYFKLLLKNNFNFGKIPISIKIYQENFGNNLSINFGKKNNFKFKFSSKIFLLFLKKENRLLIWSLEKNNIFFSSYLNRFKKNLLLFLEQTPISMDLKKSDIRILNLNSNHLIYETKTKKKCLLPLPKNFYLKLINNDTKIFIKSSFYDKLIFFCSKLQNIDFPSVYTGKGIFFEGEKVKIKVIKGDS